MFPGEGGATERPSHHTLTHTYRARPFREEYSTAEAAKRQARRARFEQPTEAERALGTWQDMVWHPVTPPLRARAASPRPPDNGDTPPLPTPAPLSATRPTSPPAPLPAPPSPGSPQGRARAAVPRPPPRAAVALAMLTAQPRSGAATFTLTSQTAARSHLPLAGMPTRFNGEVTLPVAANFDWPQFDVLCLHDHSGQHA